jgi:hypothetical protein
MYRLYCLQRSLYDWQEAINRAVWSMWWMLWFRARSMVSIKNKDERGCRKWHWRVSIRTCCSCGREAGLVELEHMMIEGTKIQANAEQGHGDELSEPLALQSGEIIETFRVRWVTFPSRARGWDSVASPASTSGSAVCCLSI